MCYKLLDKVSFPVRPTWGAVVIRDVYIYAEANKQQQAKREQNFQYYFKKDIQDAVFQI